MPEGKISYDGVEQAPDRKYVVFPSGKANEAETIVLSETGKYELGFQNCYDHGLVYYSLDKIFKTRTRNTEAIIY
jgi:hypothetical protein